MKNLLKYSYLCTIVLLNSCTNKIVKTIEHDYNKNTSTYKNNSGSDINENKAVVKEGDKVTLIVNGYNPLAIDVAATKTKGSLNYQQNNSSTLLNFLSAGKGNDETADTSIKKGGGEEGEEALLKDPIEEKKEEATEIINKYTGFYNAIATLNNYIEGAKSFSKLDVTCLCEDLKIYSDNIKNLFITNIGEYTLTACEAQFCKDLIPGSAIKNERNAYFEKFNELLKQLDELKTKQKEISKREKKALDDKRNSAIEQETKGKKAPEITKIKDRLNKEYEQRLSKAEEKNDELIKIVEDLTKQLTDLKEDYLTTRSNNIDLAINKYQALGFIEFTKNLGSFRVDEEDNFSLTLNFSNSVTSKTSERSIDLDVIKPLKIDYSAGVFVAPKLYDESFDIVKKTDTTYTINTLDNGKASYGAIGYINFHPIFVCRGFSLGGSIGTGLMFNDASKIVFSPAFSIFLGRYQRVVISVGGAFAQVDRIHSIYPNNEFKDATYKPELKKEISSSFIYSLTWNLTRK